MNIKSIALSLLALFITASLHAMEPKAADATLAKVKIGDCLRTRQFFFSDHVAVVVQCPQEATLDKKYWNQILLAENAGAGVKLVWLKDFIIRENDVSHIGSPYSLIYRASKPYRVVARAISALGEDVQYDIGSKSCGLFADWCLFGEKSGVKDFRDPNDKSLAFGPKYIIIPLANCGYLGQWVLVKFASAFDERFGEELNKLTSQEIGSIAAGAAGYCAYVNKLVRENNLPLETKESEDLPSLSCVVRDAFLLPENNLKLTDNSKRKLQFMNDEQAKAVCTRIIDNELRCIYEDINNIIDDLIYTHKL